MTPVDELIEHYRELRDKMLQDLQHGKEHGWRVRSNNKDVTAEWMSEHKRRADHLSEIIAAHEKRHAQTSP